MDSGGIVNYPPSGQSLSSSTKVLNLSRAQINLAPSSPGGPSSPQAYYAQPAQGPTTIIPGGQYNAPQSPQNAYRPQIYTVGSTQQIGQQPLRVNPPPQSPGSQVYPPSQPMNYTSQPNLAYYPQPQSPQTQQYPTYNQQQQQYPQQPMRQQDFQPQRPQGQVMYAQPAAYTPAYTQGQTTAFQNQPAPTANQQQGPVFGQPISNQPSQQWASAATFDQQRQYPSQVPVHFPAQKPYQTVDQVYTQYPNQPGTFAAEQVVPSVQATQHQPRPPISPSTGAWQKRTPSASGQPRNIKVKSLPMRGSVSVDALDKAVGPPQFVQQPVAQLTVNEGDPATIATLVRPAGDSTLSVEWFKNGKPLSASSRFSTIFDRGHAVLEFIYTNEEDTGDYSCVATNCCGQDQSVGCRFTVIPEETVVTDTQLPEESMIANLAAMENQMVQNGLARSNRYRDETQSTRPPQFVKPLSPQVGLRESAPAHFETLVEPANDPSLTVEWYKDGSPVTMGCRFNAVFDRGFAILDILYCYPEDNGAYFCVAKNSLGQVQSNVVELQCTPEASIVTNSVLSKESVSYLQSLDNWGSEQMAGYDRQAIDEEEPPSAPVFDILPQPLTVTEGSPARFLVKAGGFPRPRVQWYIDGELLASQGGGGNWRVYQDGGISYLEFHRVGNPCQQKVSAVAKNNLGEVTAETTLVIEPQLDFRPDLRHVEPDNPFKKLAKLKKVERSNELATAFSRPRPQALDLRRMERQSEHKARTAADAEALEVENLYTRVQSQLRTSRRSSMPSSAPAPVRTQMAAPTPQVQQPATAQVQYAPAPPRPTQQPPRPAAPQQQQMMNVPPPVQQAPRPAAPPQPVVPQQQQMVNVPPPVQQAPIPAAPPQQQPVNVPPPPPVQQAPKAAVPPPPPPQQPMNVVPPQPPQQPSSVATPPPPSPPPPQPQAQMMMNQGN